MPIATKDSYLLLVWSAVFKAGAIFVVPGTKPIAVVGFTVAGGRIVEIDLIADPAKLSRT